MTLQSNILNTDDEIGLHELPHRQRGEVLRLVPADDPQEREVLLRLLEIGFLPGAAVRVMARGLPGCDPLAVRIGNSTFALRRREAALIRVRALPILAKSAA